MFAEESRNRLATRLSLCGDQRIGYLYAKSRRNPGEVFFGIYVGSQVTFVHDLRNGYVTSIPLPQRVPFGVHGNWVPDR
jgi:hypothetical protein